MQVLRTHTFFHNNLSWLPSPALSASGMDAQELREFMAQYASELADLTFNSKPIINTLTMLASENVKAASSIASAIEKHIYKVGPYSSSVYLRSNRLHLESSALKQVKHRRLRHGVVANTDNKWLLTVCGGVLCSV